MTLARLGHGSHRAIDRTGCVNRDARPDDMRWGNACSKSCAWRLSASRASGCRRFCSRPRKQFQACPGTGRRRNPDSLIMCGPAGIGSRGECGTLPCRVIGSARVTISACGTAVLDDLQTEAGVPSCAGAHGRKTFESPCRRFRMRSRRCLTNCNAPGSRHPGRWHMPIGHKFGYPSETGLFGW